MTIEVISWSISTKVWDRDRILDLQSVLLLTVSYQLFEYSIGNARPIDGRPQNEVQVGPDKLEVVASFCYLGDMLSAGGGCEMAVTTRVKTAWKKFRELLPVLTSRHLSYKTRGHVYSSCVRSAMLHASETWPLTKTNLQCNDRAMIRQICSIKPENVATVRSSELLARLELEDSDLILREREKASLVWACGWF